VWATLAADAVAVLVVYSVLDPAELYNVSREGVAGGLSRALVQLNFPIALFAIPLAILALDVLPRHAWLVGAPAIGLCALVPIVVDPDDLDARPQNVLPALGVALVLVLTLVAARRAGAGFAPRRTGDRTRVGLALVVVLVSLPWFTAEAGFHLPGDVFLTEERYAEPGKSPTAAVHLGHHHGLAGTLFVLAALLLSRPRLSGVRHQHVYAGLLSLMVAYGTANLVQDFWHEQVVKRGWTSADIPSVLVPEPSVMWALVLAGAALAFVLGFARRSEVAEPAIIG
jgi:hypothetical protein